MMAGHKSDPETPQPGEQLEFSFPYPTTPTAKKRRPKKSRGLAFPITQETANNERNKSK